MTFSWLQTTARNPLRQTRQRLVLTYITVTAAIVVFFGIGFYSYVRWTLIERVDDTLKHVVQLVERSLVVKENHNGQPHVDLDSVFAKGTDDPAIERDLIYLEWFAVSGKPIKSTAIFPRPIPLVRAHRYETVEVAPGHKLRQVTVPIIYHQKLLGYLRVAHQWFEVDRPSQRLAVDLLGGALVMLVVIGGAGWFLAEIALKPVRLAYDQLKQFTADASHELRTPLAAIQTNVQVTLDQSRPSTEDYRQSLEVVERLTRRMGKLVNDLLFLARNEGRLAEEPQTTCDLNAILEQVVEEQQSLAQAAGLSLNLTATAALGMAGSPDQVSRLLTNLVGNALRYTPEGGQVQVYLFQDNNQAIIEVRDTGIGIAPQHLPHIFERFYRADKARARTEGGSGLGLAIAKAIVEYHGGEIRAESQLAKGTTLRVSLPAQSLVRPQLPRYLPAQPIQEQVS